MLILNLVYAEHFRNVVTGQINDCKSCVKTKVIFKINSRNTRDLLWVSTNLRLTEVKRKAYFESNHCICPAKEEKNHPACYQHRVQKSASVIVSECCSAHSIALYIFFFTYFQCDPCCWQFPGECFFFLLSCLTLSYESQNITNSRDESLLSTHNGWQRINF